MTAFCCIFAPRSENALEKYEKFFLKGKSRSKVEIARNTVQDLLHDVKKAEQKALRVRDEFDTIARYCVVTERELKELLDELENSSQP